MGHHKIYYSISSFIFSFTVILEILLKCEAAYTGKVLLVGFDGFRYDYTEYTDTPNFDWIRKEGVSVPHMDNVYPTITYPSMYALVTGLHAESHGIVGYTMFDAETDEWWNITNTDPRWYENAQPIWYTAGKQGLTTASYFWIGSNVEIHGYLPDFYEPYHSGTDYYAAVDTVISWFEEYDVDVVTLYFDEPDLTGHDYGPAPDSNETVSKIVKCDNTIGYLIDQLKQHELDDLINVIIVSDHGMTSCAIPQKTVDIYDYVNRNDVNAVADEGATVNILPTDGRKDAVYDALKDAHPNFQVYYKEDVPERFHFRNSELVHDIVVVADESWLMISDWSYWPSSMTGFHGYDNEIMTMKPVFMAFGPNFKQNYTSPVIHQVDIYPLMCELLDITPAPNNGSLDITIEMLRHTQPRDPDLRHNKAANHKTLNYFVVYVLLVLYLNLAL